MKQDEKRFRFGVEYSCAAVFQGNDLLISIFRKVSRAACDSSSLTMALIAATIKGLVKKKTVKNCQVHVPYARWSNKHTFRTP